MFAIKFLSSVLTRKPRTSPADLRVAAVPFTLPRWERRAVTWDDLGTELSEASAQASAILTASEMTNDEKRVLGHLVSTDARKLAEVQARKSGTTARRKSDRAREILDWAAGAANPPHPGDSPALPNQNQGRFWNLSPADFKQTEVLGVNIVTPVIPGTDPPLINMLRTEDMPRDRPSLSPTEAEFLFIEEWIKNGCPDDPL